MAFDLATNTTLQVLEALHRGEVSSVEVVDAMLANIERLNPMVNAVVAMDLERARVEATAADGRYVSGDRCGPLHGLPMTIKDAYETQGLVTTGGAPALAGHIPDRDADLVRLLRRAGAIVWAKSNVPLYSGDHQTFNEVYGRTNNPWDLTRSVGGSSGGAAAAIACGFTTAELGSDIGNSIRQPASLNGVFGLKTTWGLLSGRGHIPGPPGTLTNPDLEVYGPLGRSCGDLRLLLEVLVSSKTAFCGVPGAQLPLLERPVDIERLRVGIWSDDSVAPVDQSVRSVIEQVASDLEAAGAKIDAAIRPTTSSAALHDLYLTLLYSAMSAGVDGHHWDNMMASAAGDYGPTDDPRLALARGTTLPHRFWMRANEARARVQLDWAKLFEDVDVMIAPVMPTAAFAHDTDRSYTDRTLAVNGADHPYANILFWAGLATLPHLPAVAIPVGSTVDGLPVGMQVIGPRWSDHKLLGIGEAIASALGARFLPPPIVGP